MTPLETLRLYPPHDYSFAGLLASRAAHDPERAFLLFEGRAISWREFDAATRRAAGSVRGAGRRRGDRVATLASNRPEIIVTFFALARLGAWLVPVNPELRMEEARYMFEHAGVRGNRVRAGGGAAGARGVGAHVAGAVARFCSRAAGADGLPALADLGAKAAPLAETNRGGAEDICVLVYTSGTTGFPKGAMHSQRNVVLAGEAFVERMWLQPDDRLLAILPLFHLNALFYSVFGTIAAGASLVVVPKFSASRFWQVAAETGATQTNIIAAVGSILAQRPRSELVPHRLRKVYGGPIVAEVERVWREELGVPVMLEGYGMTEIPGACNNPFPGTGPRRDDRGQHRQAGAPPRSRARRSPSCAWSTTTGASSPTARSASSWSARRSSPRAITATRRRPPPRSATAGFSPAISSGAMRTATSGSSRGRRTSSGAAARTYRAPSSTG